MYLRGRAAFTKKKYIFLHSIHLCALDGFIYAEDLGKVSILWLQEWKELYRHYLTYAIIVQQNWNP